MDITTELTPEEVILEGLKKIKQLEADRDKWGNFVQYWDGIAIGVNDWILDTHVVSGGVETATTGGDCSTIYALQVGEGALCGLTAPG